MESVKKIMDRLKKAVHDKKERNMNKEIDMMKEKTMPSRLAVCGTME